MNGKINAKRKTEKCKNSMFWLLINLICTKILDHPLANKSSQMKQGPRVLSFVLQTEEQN